MNEQTSSHNATSVKERGSKLMASKNNQHQARSEDEIIIPQEHALPKQQ